MGLQDDTGTSCAKLFCVRGIERWHNFGIERGHKAWVREHRLQMDAEEWWHILVPHFSFLVCAQEPRSIGEDSACIRFLGH